jgi:hypothetical protein
MVVRDDRAGARDDGVDDDGVDEARRRPGSLVSARSVLRFVVDAQFFTDAGHAAAGGGISYHRRLAKLSTVTCGRTPTTGRARRWTRFC